jgi:acyl-CoA reductase-like NAD-dependent aldehyde dehydrogenase
MGWKLKVHSKKPTMEIELMKNQLEEVFQLQRAHALSLRTSTAEDRIEMLRRLHDWVLEHRQDIRDAMFADYRKPNRNLSRIV